ncbi:MAG TPA: protein kinase [Bryobacteraceae bacterium]|jgi:Tol biopolymer transport system component/predicted Ser/Thr protein kinase|nr:protein kinase [Bryobacteraceae bacterium]
MPLSPGDRLGPYEILAPIGAGGMGEVYKARDIRLDRIVALKKSKTDFDPRFEREARAVAVLNHPNICTLHDVGSDYLVMEYVEGAELKGPLPLPKAIELACQILDAIDAAHRKGITHRDLKPANILVTKSGVKVLDFGLAKMERAQGLVLAADAPTAISIEGTITGTIYYMAPEQLQGKPDVDSRADIFAFGCVLYEMLTGKRAFEGSNVASVIAAVMERPAPSVGEVAPASLDRVIKKCLAKDPDERWQNARDLKTELAWAVEAPAATHHPQQTRGYSLGIIGTAAAAIALSAAVMSWAPWKAVPEAPKPVRFQIAPAPGVKVANAFSLSPDGTRLAYPATGADGVFRLWMRAMDTLESRAVPGTEGLLAAPFFWSPDSRWVVFEAGGKLMKADVAGGPPQTICAVSATVVSGSWVSHGRNGDGAIIFGNSGGIGGIHRVSPEGGDPVPVTALNQARKDNFHTQPVFLPDGRHFLYFVNSATPENSGIYLGSLDLKPDRQNHTRLLATATGADFVPNGGGNGGTILFLREGTLLAQQFDIRRLKTIGEPMPLAEQVGNYRSFGFFSASANGALVWRGVSTGATSQLVWFDREGKRLGAQGDAHVLGDIALSPDAMRVAAVRTEGSNPDLWLTTFSGGLVSPGTDVRFTFDPTRDSRPVWSPDGEHIAFSSDRAGTVDLYQHASNGAGRDELLLKSGHTKEVTDWSRDGRWLLYSDLDAKTRHDLWVLPMDGVTPGQPMPLLRSDFDELSARFSPDGHWVAYQSDETGRYEIYVRPFPAPAGGGGRWAVSQGGGMQPRWRGDSKELFYIAPDGDVMAIPVSGGGGAFQSGRSTALFRNLPNPPGWDAAPDGKRFLFPVPVGDAQETPFNVVLNWMSLIRK